jgi:hypothetical protein
MQSGWAINIWNPVCTSVQDSFMEGGPHASCRALGKKLSGIWFGGLWENPGRPFLFPTAASSCWWSLALNNEQGYLINAFVFCSSKREAVFWGWRWANKISLVFQLSQLASCHCQFLNSTAHPVHLGQPFVHLWPPPASPWPPPAKSMFSGCLGFFCLLRNPDF